MPTNKSNTNKTISTISTFETIESYLKEHENKEMLRFITCGSVDDGKSTLIGRLLYDSKMIFEDQLAAVKNETKKYGTVENEEIDFALLIDGLQSEREQGITIDVAYRFFSTDKRKYIIADTPGHEQYTRNMVTGASTADLAVILIDARKGVLTQTRRHSFLVTLLGIRNIVVAINKMDLVDYSKEVYDKIVNDYNKMFAKLRESLPYKKYQAKIDFIPISALKGDNVVDNSKNMNWYKGLPFLKYLDNVEIQRSEFKSFRYPVQYVNRPNLDFRGFCGTISSGEINVGDKIKVYPSQKTSTIKEIIDNGKWNERLLSSDNYSLSTDSVFAPMAVTLTLNDEIDISRGDLIVKENEIEPRFNDSFEAFIVWMDEEQYKNREYYIKLYTKETNSVISKILFKKDVNTWEKLEAKTLELNDIARVQIDLTEKIAFDFYEDNKNTGAFILIDKITNNTVAAGMIVGEATKINAESFEYYQWCELKQKINKKIPLKFKEREIFFVHMGKNVGFEQNGKGSEFLRPVLVYKKFGNETFLGIPITNSLKEGMFYTQIKFKNRINTALLSQIRLFDAKRLKYFVCRLPQKEFVKIQEDLNRLINPQKRERT